MDDESLTRIVFYSKDDSSSNFNLEKAESVLRDFENSNNFDIVSLLEFYQIKQYIDHEMSLPHWSATDKENFKYTVTQMWRKIIDFCKGLNDNSAVIGFSQLRYRYQDAFWQIIEKTNTYNRISETALSEISAFKSFSIENLLHSEKLVSHYSKWIKEYFLNHAETAEILLTQFVQKQDWQENRIYFPKSLSLVDRETILFKYLDSENANLNYVRLIINSPKTQDLSLSDELRLKAKKLEQKINSEVLSSGVSFGISVQFNEDQKEISTVTRNNKDTIYTYSLKNIKENTDFLSLFKNFNILFNYIDITGMITMITKEHEANVFELFSIKAKKDYLYSYIFYYKEVTSFLQLYSYSEALIKTGTSLEAVLRYVLNSHFSSVIGSNELRFSISESSNYIEKIRTLAPEFEYFLKQYKNYVEQKQINHELLQMSSAGIDFENIPSLIEKKFVYLNDPILKKTQHSFFSDQSLLYSLPNVENKYNSLYDLLHNEDVILSEFNIFQSEAIQQLIDDGYLFIDNDGFVKIQATIELIILKQFYEYKAINYWHQPPIVRCTIDEFVEEGSMYFENTLFSKSEQQYFNFYLNKKEFTNGPDLRNKYLHGSNSNNEKEQMVDYFKYLKLVILGLLRIEDEFVNFKKISNSDNLLK